MQGIIELSQWLEQMATNTVFVGTVQKNVHGTVHWLVKPNLIAEYSFGSNYAGTKKHDVFFTPTHFSPLI